MLFRPGPWGTNLALWMQDFCKEMPFHGQNRTLLMACARGPVGFLGVQESEGKDETPGSRAGAARPRDGTRASKGAPRVTPRSLGCEPLAGTGDIILQVSGVSRRVGIWQDK